ncbi:MAG: hypothetical protein ABSA51_03925 [Anaerolineaceae bacterium]|jgi:hypothetical protein
MIYLIRNADGTLKTFMEQGSDCVLAPGETLELQPGNFADYAARLRLSVDGISGEMVQRQQGSGDVTVQVACPGQAAIDLEVNGLTESVALTNGTGQLVLSADAPGTFEVRPADRALYCAAGEAVLTVEVIAAMEPVTVLGVVKNAEGKLALRREAVEG